MFIPIGDNVEKRIIPVVSMMLIIANVMIFLYQLRQMATEGETAAIETVETFGLVPVELTQGHVLGLLTHMFLHGGLAHLIGNMVVLWAFCATLEGGMGSLMLLALYLAWGVAGGLAHAGLHLDDSAPLIGASGAIAGAIGAYCVAYGPFSRIHCIMFIFMRPVHIHVPAGVFGGLWLMEQIYSASYEVDGFDTGVAWFAHLGGFAAGAVTMFLLRNQMDNELVESADGRLILRGRSPVVEEIDPALLGALTIPDHCPHCGGSLDESHRMSDILARCPYPSCERLVYLNAVPV
jgi:membrane associated rhomboid family serine protease